MIRLYLKRIIRWMHYNPPGSLTSTGWRLFDEEYKKVAPIRHYIYKDIHKKYIRPIKFKINDLSNWIRVRTYDRYHIINTGLKPDYQDISTQLLHSSFNLLKDFVEIEQSLHYYYYHSHYDEVKKDWKLKLPLYSHLFYRNPDYGIKHLEWESTLDDPTLPVNQRDSEQAKKAREILILYRWWIDRPNRKQIDYCSYSDQGFPMGCLDDDFDKTAEDYVNYKNNMILEDQQTEQWAQEDTDMLIRLVNIRDCLWS